MTDRGKHTYKEITQQPAAWEDARQTFSVREDKVLEAWAEGKFRFPSLLTPRNRLRLSAKLVDPIT